MPRSLIPLLAACCLTVAARSAPAQIDPGAAPATPNAATPDETKAPETAWAVLLLGGDRIGWTRTAAAPLADDEGTRTDTETSMTFRRFGQKIAMAVELTTEENAAGELQSFEMVTKNPGSAETTATGVRRAKPDGNGDVLELTTTVNGNATVRDIPLPPGLKSPSHLDTILTDGSLDAGAPVSFQTFFPELGKVGTVTVTKAAAAAPVELPTGETRELTAVTVAQDVLPFPSTLYVDADGEPVFDSTDFLGQQLVTYEVSKEEALRALFDKGRDDGGGGTDMGFDMLVSVDRVPNVHRTKWIVYEVAVEEAEATELFLTADSQQVEPLANGRARVTVTGLPVVPTATAGAAPEFAGSTRYLQSDDARVIAHAKAASPAGAPAGRVAADCAAYVGRTLTNKGFSTALASAAEVAENLAGDCTEHSVLCAAMLRARGVPSRVCVGLVTIPGRGQMGGHMWVEAYLDADGPDGPAAPLWVPLDPTITGGAIGGGHLLLGRSDLNEDAAAPIASFLPMLEVIGRLTVDVLESK